MERKFLSWTVNFQMSLTPLHFKLTYSINFGLPHLSEVGSLSLSGTFFKQKFDVSSKHSAVFLFCVCCSALSHFRGGRFRRNLIHMNGLFHYTLLSGSERTCNLILEKNFDHEHIGMPRWRKLQPLLKSVLNRSPRNHAAFRLLSSRFSHSFNHFSHPWHPGSLSNPGRTSRGADSIITGSLLGGRDRSLP